MVADAALQRLACLDPTAVSDAMDFLSRASDLARDCRDRITDARLGVLDMLRRLCN
jgi:hypothetical protein